MTTPLRVAAAGAGADDPAGEFSYAPGSAAYDEIHRALPDRQILERYDAVMRNPVASAAERRAAQLEILHQVKVAPLRLFRQLRSERPVLDLDTVELYVVTRDDDVRLILNTPTVCSVRDYRDRMEPVVGPYMLNRDAHPRYNMEEKPWMRTLLRPADFPRIRDIARDSARDGIARGTDAGGQLDVVAHLGRAVPVAVVRAYFGFRATPEKLLEWSFKTQDSFFHNVAYLRGLRGFLVRTFGVGGAALQAAQREALAVHGAAIAAGEEMRRFLTDELEQHRAEILASDTVFGRMLAGNGGLSFPKQQDRMIANVIGGLVGAVETTNAAIVQSLNQLLAVPQRLEAARRAAQAVGADTAIQTTPFAGCVWEALRFHPINPFVVRYVEQDTVIGAGDQAVRLRRGRRVLVATHSAMHDPLTVHNPDDFDVARPQRDREMNLGYATHRCLGDAVAEVMVPETIRQLLLLPGLQRVPEAPPIPINQGIDFGRRGSFPERYLVRYTRG